jgi:hypothetical protein
LNPSIAPDRTDDGIDASDDMIDVYIEGELRYELWEDPERPFGCAPKDLARYVEHEAWVLLFNAVALTGTRRVTEPAA